MSDHTKLRFGFRSENQLPLFMVWREYWVDGDIVDARVIVSTDHHTDLLEFLGGFCALVLLLAATYVVLLIGVGL